MATSITIPAVVERVLSRLPDNGRPFIYGPEISAWLNEGLYRVALNNQDAPEFMKTVTGLTIASGVLTVADTTLIMASIPRGRVTVNATPAFSVPSYDDLRPAGLPLDVYYYTIEGLNLVFRGLDGVLGTLSSAANVTIVAVAVPTMASLPLRFEPVLIEELVKLAMDAIHAKKSKTLGDESDTTVDLAELAQ